MGAILGGRAIVGKNSHVGAGAVLAGVIEPASAEPVRVGTTMFSSGPMQWLSKEFKSVVVQLSRQELSLPKMSQKNVVVAGVPARIIKEIDAQTQQKTALEDALRTL